MSLDTRKILFFVAGPTPTVAELAAIARIRGDVQVRNVLAEVTYNGRLEIAEGLAGAIPDSYKTAAETTIDLALFPYGDVTLEAVASPEEFKVFPATYSVLANGGKIRLSAISADLNETTGAIVMTDRSVLTTVAWASATEAKATVDTDGLVTGANGGTGTAVISATYTYADGLTKVATATVTLT